TKINEVVATFRPVDILFLIDNSGTMDEERAEIRRNVGLFITELAESSVDFQVGIITPDIECNVPERNCEPGGTSLACCALNPPLCADSASAPGGPLDTTSCDAGRLRGQGTR